MQLPGGTASWSHIGFAFIAGMTGAATSGFTTKWGYQAAVFAFYALFTFSFDSAGKPKIGDTEVTLISAGDNPLFALGILAFVGGVAIIIFGLRNMGLIKA